LTRRSGIFHHNAKAIAAIVVAWRTENPHSRLVHRHDSIDSFGCTQTQNGNSLWRRNRIAIERDDFKPMPRKCKLNVFRRTRIQNPKHDTFALLDPDRIAIPELLAIDRKRFVSDFPSVVGRRRRCRMAATKILVMGKERLPLMCGEKNLTIVISRFAL